MAGTATANGRAAARSTPPRRPSRIDPVTLTPTKRAPEPFDLDALVQAEQSVAGEFRFAGRLWEVPALGAVELMDLADLMTQDLDQLSDKESMELLLYVLDVCVAPEEQDAFRQALREQHVGLQALLALLGYVMSVSTGFPTEPPSPSANTSAASGGSTAGNRAQRRSRA